MLQSRVGLLPRFADEPPTKPMYASVCPPVTTLAARLAAGKPCSHTGVAKPVLLLAETVRKGVPSLTPVLYVMVMGRPVPEAPSRALPLPVRMMLADCGRHGASGTAQLVLAPDAEPAAVTNSVYVTLSS